LSGGVRQRLALAVALLSSPPILFMDEPTSNLDESSRGRFFSFLADRKRMGTTIIFSSHRMEEVSSLADRVLVLEAGKIVSEYGPGADAETPTRMMRVLVEPPDIGDALDALARGGFEASRNGRGLWVRVSAEKKAEPIAFLLKSNIDVKDFDLPEQTSKGAE
jgi:ABC-type multidrug transport system ATPase subunit